MNKFKIACIAVFLLLLGLFAGMHLQTLIAERDYYRSKSYYYEARMNIEQYRSLTR